MTKTRQCSACLGERVAFQFDHEFGKLSGVVHVTATPGPQDGE